MIRSEMGPLSIIVAVDSQGGFSKNGKIPWNFPVDIKYFMNTTKNGVCIMGRQTYEDILKIGKLRRKTKNTKGDIDSLLPGRECYVVTSNPNYVAEGATSVTSIISAVQSISKNDTREIFILGGRRMFIEALAFTTKIYMSIIKGPSYNCDKFFPIRALTKFNILSGNKTDTVLYVTYAK